MPLPRLLLPLLACVLALTAVPSALGSPSESYLGPHFGNGRLPAECITDRDPINPDNLCYHMKVGLNALDSPKVDVDVLIPVSPAAERDMRVATQAVQMWDDGLHYLADQMDLEWLSEGFEMDVRTRLVPVDDNSIPLDPVNLVDPEIIVIVSNPVGGIGIGIDPTAFGGELGLYDDQGLPCAEVANPFSMDAWEARSGFEQHGGEPGGVFVQDCGGVGGNVCFAVNGAVDPVPGLSDFFPLFELVSHEFGHCLTIGHVGDGADGPWGPTPTNDIMAYSTDPPLVNKCVSTLDVEGFALRMSNYLDVNGDRVVDGRDRLKPNDVAGDGFSSFQVQHPADHAYASSTGDARDCPQPDVSLVPGAEGDFMPKAVSTRRPQLSVGSVVRKQGLLTVRGTARRVSRQAPPTSTSGGRSDTSGDSVSPITDITGVKVKVSKTHLDATMEVGRLWPVMYGTSPVAYSLTIDGRRLDSFIPTGATDGQPVVLDNGTGYLLPAGTATWDAAADTVRFHVRRDYLADQQLRAPYNVYGVTGYHARTNDWIATDDVAPDKRDLDVAGPRMGREVRDAPVAAKVTSTTYSGGSGTFLPSDSTLGVGLISAVDSRDYVTVPIALQSSVLVTLKGDGNAGLGLTVGGGSSQQVIEHADPDVLQVLVPWARRDLTVTVDPQEVYAPSSYTLTVKRTSVIADRDRDGVPDIADNCRNAKGPSTGAGCPDSDGDGIFDRLDRCPTVAGTGADGCPTRAGEKVVAYLDGRSVDSFSVVTRHGADRFVLATKVGRGKHTLKIKWFDAGSLVKVVRRTLR